VQVAFLIGDIHLKDMRFTLELKLLRVHAPAMAQITKKDLVALFPKYFFFTKASKPLHRLIKGGDLPFPIHSEDADAQVLQKLAELFMQNVCAVRRFLVHH
jgi:hypothetical protein